MDKRTRPNLSRLDWLPIEMNTEIVKQSSNIGDKLNLLCAHPGLLSAVSKSYPRKNPNAANGGEGTEAKPPKIYIKYSPEKKMFWSDEMGRLNPGQPPRIFGLNHEEVVLVYLDLEDEHAAILLDALKSTSTTTKKLNCCSVNKAGFLSSFDFAKVLNPSHLELDFGSNEEWATLNEVVEAFPDLSELSKLLVWGPVRADGDSLLSHFSKFPPFLCFTNTSFLHTGDVAKFFRALDKEKFEERSPAAVALERIVNWKFQISYDTHTEEGEAMNGYRPLSELAAGILFDSENEHDIFELRLDVGDEQHVIYVKEEVDSDNRCRSIQLVNQIADFRKNLDSPHNSQNGSTLGTDEQMLSSDNDPDPDFSDADDDSDDD